MLTDLQNITNFNEIDKEILKYWEEREIFKKSLEKNKGQKRFVFYEGPPTANAKPHLGHVLPRAFKDLYPRYKTMKGFHCLRKSGWDTHGLPVELEIEKKLGLSGKDQIEKYGILEFNKKCRESVLEYVSLWENLTTRIGFWLDLKEPYMTLSPEYIESLWSILKTFWNKKLLVKDYKVLPYCYRCETPLSSHELAQGYKDIKEESVFVKFELKPSSRQKIFKLMEPVKGNVMLDGVSKSKVFLLAWTTTPWTLPGNVALAINPNSKYSLYYDSAKSEIYVFATGSASTVLEVKKNPVYTIGHLEGKQLEGLEYIPLFDFLKYEEKSHFVLGADFVSLEEGTGIVHTAVMYGVDDFNLGVKNSLPKKHAVGLDGKFIDEIKDFRGINVKDADKPIKEALEQRGLLYKKEIIQHSYPFCWRCDTPLIYYALESYFIKTTLLKDKIIHENSKIDWHPKHLKDGRMGDWLKNMNDWAVSRSRYWGTPLPIWICTSCGESIAVGSFSELNELSLKPIDVKHFDPHRPFVDEVFISCPKCKKEAKRVPYVLDCWFDSGAMPFAQWHYPFDNQKQFNFQFPADFICEAIDQTRGWFYTLLAVSTLYSGKCSFKTVLTTGHVLDEKGKKMSKSKGNVVDPFEALDKFGADVIRWNFYSGSSLGLHFRSGFSNLEETKKRFFMILWNSLRFFKLYSNDVDFSKTSSVSYEHILDKWIISRLNSTVKLVTNRLEKYDAYKSSKAIESFVINDLSTWFIRRSRERFSFSNSNLADRLNGLTVLGEVFLTLSKVLAPYTPFISEKIYLVLTQGKSTESVHLESWPKVIGGYINKELEKSMVFARKIVEAIHSQRQINNLSLRQPLSLVEVWAEEDLAKGLEEIILSEVNVKKIKITKAQEFKVVLNITITKELQLEGIAREIVRSLQEERKKQNLGLNDKVTSFYPKNNLNDKAVLKFYDEIKRKTFSLDILGGDKYEVCREF